MKLQTPSDLEGLSNQVRRCSEHIRTKRDFAFTTSGKKRKSDEVCEANNKIISTLPEKIEVSKSLAQQMVTDAAVHCMAVGKIDESHATDAFHILIAMARAPLVLIYPPEAIGVARSATKFVQRIKGHEAELRDAQERRDRILGPVLSTYLLAEPAPGHFELRRGTWYSQYVDYGYLSSYSPGPNEDYNPQVGAGVESKLLLPEVQRLLNNPGDKNRGAGQNRS